MKKLIINHKMSFFIVMNLLMTIGMNLAHPVTPTLLKNLNLGPHVFGISFAAMSTTNFLFSLIWSNVANTMKKSRILMISSVGYALAQLIFGFASTEGTIYVARLLSGVFAGGFQVGFMAYIVSEAPVERQTYYITYSSIIVSVGAALGFFIGGFLGDISILLTFIVQAGLHISLGIIFFLVLGPLEVLDEHVEWSMVRKANPFRIMKEAWPLVRGFTFLILVSTLVSSIGVTLFDQSFNYYIKDIFDFIPSKSGMIKFVTGLLAIVLNVLLLKRKFTNQPRVLKVIFGIMSLLSILMSFVSNVLLFLVLSLFVYGAYTTMLPVLQNLVISQRRSVQEGNQLAGVYSSLSMLGKIFGALLTSFVYSLNPAATFWVAGVIFIISLVVLYVPTTKKNG